MRSATLYIRVPRTVVAPWRDIYCTFRPSSRRQRFVLEFTWKIGLKKKKKIRIIPLSSCVCLTSSFVHFRGPKILPFNFAKEHRSFKRLLWLLFVSPERFHWNYDVCPTTTNFFRDFCFLFVFLLHCLNKKHLCGAIEETNTAAYAFAGAGIFSWEFWWTDVCI